MDPTNDLTLCIRLGKLFGVPFLVAVSAFGGWKADHRMWFLLVTGGVSLVLMAVLAVVSFTGWVSFDDPSVVKGQYWFGPWPYGP
jgi:hypothetical protein